MVHIRAHIKRYVKPSQIYREFYNVLKLCEVFNCLCWSYSALHWSPSGIEHLTSYTSTTCSVDWLIFQIL